MYGVDLKSVMFIFIILSLTFLGGYLDYKKEEVFKKEIATAKAQASAVQAARVTEQTIIKADVAVSKTYQEGLQDGKKELNVAIAKLRAERLRHRAAANASVPSNPATASGCYAEAGSDVLESMARLAGEADDVARQLDAAQDLLRNRQ